MGGAAAGEACGLLDASFFEAQDVRPIVTTIRKKIGPIARAVVLRVLKVFKKMWITTPSLVEHNRRFKLRNESGWVGSGPKQGVGALAVTATRP